MYILNEKDYIRNILVSRQKPADLTMGCLITLIAKYYYSSGSDSETLSGIVKEKLLEFDLDNYQEYKYHNKITGICDSLYNGETTTGFKEREFIPIYESELNLISTLKNDRQKKLMFTFFALARYMDCDGWINKKSSKELSEVFRLANVTLTSEKRNELLHELYSDGYITFGKKVDNLNIKIPLEDSGDIAYRLTCFNHIGNQYIGNFKKGYRQCRTCGKKIKVIGANQQYCRTCSRKNESENNKKRIRKCREKQK